jgi:quercetin dioxygenase-like cupin family protein
VAQTSTEPNTTEGPAGDLEAPAEKAPATESARAAETGMEKASQGAAETGMEKTSETVLEKASPNASEEELWDPWAAGVMGKRRSPLMRPLILALALNPVFFFVAWNVDSEAGQLPPRDAPTYRIQRTELQHTSSSVPGREIVQVRTEIPSGVASGWHTHPGEEVGYVVTGRVDIEVEGRSTLRLREGDRFLIPPGVAHNAHDLGPETGVVLSTYLVEHGRPLTTSTPQE